MRLRKRTIVIFVAVLSGLAALVIVAPKAAPPMALSVVSVAEGRDSKRVTVAFQRLDPAAHFGEPQQLQIRVGGSWQPPLDIPKLEEGYLIEGTNSQQLVFDFPRETEACRFSLGYRVGPRPYCQAYFFLSRHGVSKDFPAFSKAILKCVPKQPMLRHFESEVEIQTETSDRPPQPAPGGAGRTDVSVKGAGPEWLSLSR